MAYRQLKAYEDIDFLKSDVCRGVRLQLEFLQPDTVLDQHRIESTIVIFGSARILPPEDADARLAEAERALQEKPDDEELQQRCRLARTLLDQSRYYEMAREFAAIVSSDCRDNGVNDFVVTTGGGGGIMEAGNLGAHDVDALSIGLNITLPHEQEPNDFITDELCFQFHYFSIRKMHFLKRARALCAFPGGYGTMDELFETLTLIQTRKMPRIPVVLFGSEFWKQVVNWEVFVERGLISPGDLTLFHMCDDAQEGWDHIREFYGESRS